MRVKRKSRCRPYLDGPRVVQTITVELECQILNGASALRSVQATGHEVNEYDDFVDVLWD